MTVVGVTGLNSFLGAPGMGIVRALRLSGDRDLRIVGMDYSPFSDGLFSGSLDKAYVIPHPRRRRRFLERLKEINKVEKIDVIIPSLDEEVVLLSEMRDSIESLGIRCLIPESRCVSRVRDKASQIEFMRESGIPHPKSMIVTASSNLDEITRDMRFPVLIKCEDGAFPAFNEEELRILMRRLGRKKFVVQEYLKGDEYSICILAHPEGRIYGYVIQKKLGQSDIGSTLIGVVVERRDVLEISRDFVEKLGWIGPMELEFIGMRELYLTDVNLRFPAWVSLTAAAGVNLPYAVVQIALGRKYEIGRQRTGLAIVRAVEDLYVDIFDIFKYK